MRLFLLALLISALAAAPSLAQTATETQAPVPIGGADTRSLPDRSQLPPMFGANLFRPGNPSVQFTGSSPAVATMPSSTSASGGPNLAGGGLGGLIGAALTGAQGGANPTAALAQAGAAAAGAAPVSPAVPATTVQPPSGVAVFDPNHVMVPGDMVQIHIYGATTLDQQATVDGNGDIFLPSIGPVHVAGITAGNLQAAVAAAVASVYHSNAMLYVTLANTVPVNVFVTGAVVAPGEYAQPSTASVITYLQAAGGVDPNRGSYRDIRILRDGRTIATADLYDFLLHGRLPTVRLRDRDTILVGAQGLTVAAEGDVSGVFRYELNRPYAGGELIALARPYPDATRVNLVGIRAGRPAAFYYSLPEFRRVSLENGDVVTFTPDTPTNVMTVKLEGRIDGPTTLVVIRQARLLDVLPYVPINEYFSDPSSIYVRRLSVAQAQTKAIQDAFQRLESTVVTSPTVTAEQAQMRQQEATIIFQFAKQLTNVQPEGRLVVEHDGHPTNVRLEDGDVIVVPSRTDLVLVSGEVRVPQAMVWLSGADVQHYITTAGGFTERANTSGLLVIRPSGETIVGPSPPVLPGDHVIVLPSPDNWSLPFIKDITQIIYQIAVATGVALRF
ncbi:MAG TPA: polysaccharide biosynthesis/export family protein [Stellaceae bacterium]